MTRRTADATVESGSPSVSLAVSAVLSAGLLGGAAITTGLAADGTAGANAAAVAAGQIDTTVLAQDGSTLGIASSNLAAAGFLIAGAPLLGTLTLVGLALIGIGVGVSAASVVAALGPIETLSRIAPYIVFEASGVLLAAMAGVLPVVHLIAQLAHRRRSPLRAYTEGLGYSLRLAAIAAVLIVLGAYIESIIVARGA